MLALSLVPFQYHFPKRMSLDLKHSEILRSKAHIHFQELRPHGAQHLHRQLPVAEGADCGIDGDDAGELLRAHLLQIKRLLAHGQFGSEIKWVLWVGFGGASWQEPV